MSGTRGISPAAKTDRSTVRSSVSKRTGTSKAKPAVTRARARHGVGREGEPAGGGGLGEDHVAHVQPLGERPARADADQLLHVILADQLVDVDRRGRLPHPGPLHRHLLATEGAGVAEHAAYFGVAGRVVEERLRDPLGALGVAGQQDHRGDVSGLRADVGAHDG